MSQQGPESFPQEDLTVLDQLDISLEEAAEAAPDMGDPGAAEY